MSSWLGKTGRGSTVVPEGMVVHDRTDYFFVCFHGYSRIWSAIEGLTLSAAILIWGSLRMTTLSLRCTQTGILKLGTWAGTETTWGSRHSPRCQNGAR